MRICTGRWLQQQNAGGDASRTDDWQMQKHICDILKVIWTQISNLTIISVELEHTCVRRWLEHPHSNQSAGYCPGPWADLKTMMLLVS